MPWCGANVVPLPRVHGESEGPGPGLELWPEKKGSFCNFPESDSGSMRVAHANTGEPVSFWLSL